MSCLLAVGLYFSACVNTLNIIRVLFVVESVWSLSSLPAASVATAYLFTTTKLLVHLAPLLVLSRVPVMMISLDPSFSVLGVLVNFSE